jgi:multiple sugar transport system substrate-binding protein
MNSNIKKMYNNIRPPIGSSERFADSIIEKAENNQFKLRPWNSPVAVAGVTVAVIACSALVFLFGELGGLGGFGSDVAPPPRAPLSESLATHEALPDIEVTQKLTYLTWYDVDENSTTAELYKAKYGVPEPEKGDNIFNVIHTAYEDRLPMLNMLVASGDSPDLFPYCETYFPLGASFAAFAPVDDVIDFSGEEWDATRPLIEQHRLQGRDYTAITELSNSTSLLYYRKSVIEEAGLEDPYELWKKNRWSWGTFTEMCKIFSEPENGKYGIMGYYIDESAITTTGTAMVTLQDGELKSNLDNSRIERAMDFVQNLATNDLRYPYHEISNFQILPTPFRNGDVLFWNDGPWRYEQEIKAIRDFGKWCDTELRIVPFPRDPKATDYFQRARHEALMFVSGSRNQNGFKAWTQCAVVVAQNPVAQVEAREKMKIEHGYTEFQLDVLEEIRELAPVFEFGYGIGHNGKDFNSCTFNAVTKPVITEGESFYKTREEFRWILDIRIYELNSNKLFMSKD